MVSELFEGRVHCWSKCEAGRTACDCHLLDLLFLTAFGLRGLLCYFRSICSSEEPLSFHAKRFLVALATSFLRSGGIQCLFAVYSYFLSVYFGFGLFSSFFLPDLYLSFLRMLFSLRLCAIWANQKQKGRIFLMRMLFSLRLSVISENQKHWGKYLVSG